MTTVFLLCCVDCDIYLLLTFYNIFCFVYLKKYLIMLEQLLYNMYLVSATYISIWKSEHVINFYYIQKVLRDVQP